MVGPLTFITGWALLGAGAAGYDPIRQAISRLAAFGASTRPTMTAALLVLAGGMALYGQSLRPRTGWWLPVANGLATLAVALLPLGGGVDAAHGVAAAAGYVTLAAIPVLVGRRPGAVAVGVVAGVCLVASVLVAYDGLFQRLGLTLAQLWVVFSSMAVLRSPTSSSTTPGAPAPATPRR